MDGFGKIAFGLRSGVSPDPLTLKCWQNVITSAVRGGDVIMPPEIELPAHWAANALAYRFLKRTKADTLLLIDDDMIFDCQHVNAMRDNADNWPYGILQALCCSRRPPHMPIVLLASPIVGAYHPCKPGTETKTIEVGMVGLAFTLIRREVFEKLDAVLPPDEHYFQWGANCGEDETFCRSARAAGVKIGVDTEVSIGHRCRISVRWNKEKGEVEHEGYISPVFCDMLEGLSKKANEEAKAIDGAAQGS